MYSFFKVHVLGHSPEGSHIAVLSLRIHIHTSSSWIFWDNPLWCPYGACLAPACSLGQTSTLGDNLMAPVGSPGDCILQDRLAVYRLTPVYWLISEVFSPFFWLPLPPLFFSFYVFWVSCLKCRKKAAFY